MSAPTLMPTADVTAHTNYQRSGVGGINTEWKGLTILLVVICLAVGVYLGTISSDPDPTHYTQSDVTRLCDEGAFDTAKFLHSLGKGELGALEAAMTGFADARCAEAYNAVAPLQFHVR